MSEFQNQLDKSIFNSLNEFNTVESLSNVESTCKLKFEEIKELILSKNERIVIEDIIFLDKNNEETIMDNFLLIKEVNRGIKVGKILKDDIL